MSQTLPTPSVLSRSFDDRIGPPLSVYELRWEESAQTERLWDLPEGLCVVGPPPARFGVKVERTGPDAYSVRLLWERTALAWEGIGRVPLLASALTPVLAALGCDFRAVLDQPVRARPKESRKTG
jgi:hypothetical protein